MKQDYTAIGLVVDRSGSMSGVRNDTIGGINTFINEQKEGEGDVSVTIAQFDGQYEVTYDFVDIDEVKEFTEADFVPRGSTALLDAIGKTIDAMEERITALPEDERPANVIISIITDGYENTSNQYTKEKIEQMITLQEDVAGWDIMFMGANLDSINVAQSYGIKGGKSLVYDTGKMDTAFATISKSALRCRGGLDATYTANEVQLNAHEDKDGSNSTSNSL